MSIRILVVTGMVIVVMIITYLTTQLGLSQSPATISISIIHSSTTSVYDPSAASVMIGTNVTWTNRDSIEHTVTSIVPSSGAIAVFDSGILQPNQNYTYSFGTSGIFYYYCTLHPTMRGQVIVS
jgi:plastocyanin